ncbi:hypothetical protein GQ55_2G202900 [Panicum hallii var. hallii]|uniref:Secreted protein n=1 Tax=Panicum hallii var. hallii TaxID=1504633 RepID=A0A2T7EQQ4_9POAL|nr:hypothetical protein GQ55_2G202900 [Panicum hallii var. hallii]
MSISRAVLVICMFLLASSTHLQAARVFARNDHRVHDKKGSVVSTSSATDSATPCLHDAQVSALAPPANEPADIASDGHGRVLWSTPSDGVGH